MAERSLVYRFEGRFDNLKSGLATAGKSVDDFGGKLMAADRNGAKMRAGLDQLGGTAGKVGLAAAAGLGAVVMASANFDQAMSNVKAATQESASNMDLLREAALKAGAETKFSATEAASAIEELSKAGVSVRDILGGGLDGAMALAAAGNLEVGQAAEIAASALTQFGLAGKDVPHVADLLAAGAGKAQGEVTDLAGALNQSGLVAAQTGLSIEETVGTLSAFASAGLMGSDAGTSFKTMLQALTPSSEEAAKTMDRLGITAYDAQGNFVGMSAFAQSLQDSLKGLSVEQQNAAMKTIFGSDAVRAAAVLFKEGAAGVDEWTAKVNDSGYAAKVAADRMNNLKGDWEQFTGALQTALIGTGDSAQGPLRELLQGATKVVDTFNKLPPAAQGAVTGLMGVTAVAGGGLWAFSKVTNAVSDTREALTNLGTTSPKAARGLRMVAGAGAGIAALAVMAEGIEALEKAMDRSLPTTEKLTKNLLAIQSGKSGDLGGQFDDLSKAIGQVDAASDGLGGKLNTISSWGDKLGAGGALGLVWDSPSQKVGDYKEKIDALDVAFAGLVASGGPEAARQAFADMADAQGLSAERTKQLQELMPQYAEALDGAANEATLATTATETLTTAQGSSVQMTEEQAEAFKQAQKEARGAAEGFVNLGDSLSDSSVSLGDWLTELEKQAAALRDFRINARDAAKKGLDEGLIASLKAAGPEGALRMGELASATEAEIGRANRAWRQGQAEINRFVDATAKVPPGVATNLTVTGGFDAAAQARELKRALDALPRDVNISIRRTVLVQGAKNRGDMADLRRADGGTIGRAAWGSTVPKTGLPYADRHLYLLADGEEVITNRHGEADRRRPLLKAINEGADSAALMGLISQGMIRGQFANGGTPGLAKGGTSKGKGSLGLFDMRSVELAALQGALGSLTAAAERSAARLNDESQARDSLVSTMESLHKSDLFGDKSSFSATSLGPLDQLRRDNADIQTRMQLQAQASSQGITGAAFAELVSKTGLPQLAGLLSTKGFAPEYQKLFDQRESSSGQLGAAAGNAGFGKTVAVLEAKSRADAAHQKRLENRIDQLEKSVRASAKSTGKEVAKGANGAVRTGARNRR